MDKYGVVVDWYKPLFRINRECIRVIFRVVQTVKLPSNVDVYIVKIVEVRHL